MERISELVSNKPISCLRTLRSTMSAEDTETKAVEVEVDDDEEETPVQTGESAKEGAQLDSITDLVEEKELNQKKVNDVRTVLPRSIEDGVFSAQGSSACTTLASTLESA